MPMTFRMLALGTLLICLSRLAVADPSGWQGTRDASGADLTRPQFTAQIEVPGTEGTVGIGTTVVDASVKAWFDDDHFTLTTQDLVRGKVEEFAGEWNVPLQTISLGDYAGYFVETPVSYSPGGGGGGGFRHAGVGAAGRGYLTNGEYVFTFEYSVGGDGVWTNAHQELMLAQASAAQQEARAIVMGLRPYRAPTAPPAPPADTAIDFEQPPLDLAAPPSPSPAQEIPWATLVGTGAGVLILASALAALKRMVSSQAAPSQAAPSQKASTPKASPKQAPSKKPKAPSGQPPAIYVLQLSTDHVQLDETAPASLTISVWKVDPVSQSYQIAQDAIIEVTAPPQLPQLRLSSQPAPGQLKCQLTLTGPPSTNQAHLRVAARAGGTQHSAQVTIDLAPVYRLEFF